MCLLSEELSNEFSSESPVQLSISLGPLLISLRPYVAHLGVDFWKVDA